MTVYIWFEHTGCKIIRELSNLPVHSLGDPHFESNNNLSKDWKTLKTNDQRRKHNLRSSGKYVGSMYYPVQALCCLEALKVLCIRRSAADNQPQTSSFTKKRVICLGSVLIGFYFRMWYSRGLEVEASGSKGVLVERRMGGAVGLTGKDTLKSIFRKTE